MRSPLVDRWALGLLKRRMLTPDDFSPSPGEGVLLSREALRRTVGLFEKEVAMPFACAGGTVSFRQLFRRQAERLRGALLGEAAYEGFRWQD